MKEKCILDAVNSICDCKYQFENIEDLKEALTDYALETKEMQQYKIKELEEEIELLKETIMDLNNEIIWGYRW